MNALGAREAGRVAVGALAFGFSVWAIAGAGQSTVYWGFLLLIVGLPVLRRDAVPDGPWRGRTVSQLANRRGS